MICCSEFKLLLSIYPPNPSHVSIKTIERRSMWDQIKKYERSLCSTTYVTVPTQTSQSHHHPIELLPLNPNPS